LGNKYDDRGLSQPFDRVLKDSGHGLGGNYSLPSSAGSLMPKIISQTINIAVDGIGLCLKVVLLKFGSSAWQFKDQQLSLVNSQPNNDMSRLDFELTQSEAVCLFY
jgi:hypothetical protein